MQKTLIDGADGWMRGCWVEGSEAGTGEALARIILPSLRARHHHGTGEQARGATGQTSTPTSIGDGNGNEEGDGRQKVVFLTGETRRDVVPRVLREGGVAVEEVVVYETRVDDGLEAEVRRSLRETEGLAQTSGVRWVVIFSGQGAKEMLRGLAWLNEGGRAKGEEEGGEGEEGGKGGICKDTSRRSTFVASIGPTTADYLKTELGLQVDVCAEKPTGEALREGIERFMQEAHDVSFVNMATPVAERPHDVI